MACQRVLLSDDRAEAHLLFKPIEDIVIYKDLDDLKSKINLYLDNEKLYKKTANAARNAVVKNYSSKICVKKMLEQIG